MSTVKYLNRGVDCEWLTVACLGSAIGTSVLSEELIGDKHPRAKKVGRQISLSLLVAGSVTLVASSIFALLGQRGHVTR